MWNMNKVKRSALVQLGRWRGGGQVPEDVSMRVWPTLAVGLEPDGAAGRALIYAAHPWAWLWWPRLPFSALPLIGVTRWEAKGQLVLLLVMQLSLLPLVCPELGLVLPY